MAYERPTLAIVVPTFERADPLIRLLTDLRAQIDERAEVVVVDQSAPSTRARVAREVRSWDEPRIRLVSCDEVGLPNARNVGLSETSAAIVLFLDDDVRLSPGTLRGHVDAYRDPGVGGVVGRIVERVVRPNATGTVNRVARSGRVRTNLSGDRACRVDVLKGANMSFRRVALEQVGGFDRNYRGTSLLEDGDVSERVRHAGWELWFAPEGEVAHSSEPTGGVRQASARETERWRFHNTAYFVRRHRPAHHYPLFLGTFSAIAVRRAVEWRDPGAVQILMRALRDGWCLAAGPTDVERN